ncbi:uncharacterized protein LOC144433319 [Glandiceps talaboti]
MFSAVSRIVGQIFGNTKNGNTASPDNVTVDTCHGSLSENSAAHVCARNDNDNYSKTTQQNELTSRHCDSKHVFGSDNIEKHESITPNGVSTEALSANITSKQFTGKVTHLHTGYGLIDNEVYFPFDTIIGGTTRPQVGTRVHATAHREHSRGGWVASKVMPIVEWDLSTKEVSPPVIETIVGTVTKMCRDNTYGVINDSITFTIHVLPDGYLPYRGDWVKCETQKDDITLTVTAVSVKPVRERSFDGEVTSFHRKYGVIDGEIAFSIFACPTNFQPYIGDRVEGTAIESKQMCGNWRALSVKPKTTKDTFSPTVKHIQELLSNKNGISISEPLEFGKMKVGEERYITVWLRNCGLVPQTLTKCQLCSLDNQLSFEIPQLTGVYRLTKSGDPTSLSCVIQPQLSIYINISCKARNMGKHSELVTFHFDNFVIGRHVRFEVVDPRQLKLTCNSAPFQKSLRYKKFEDSVRKGLPRERWVIPGERPIIMKKLMLPVKLSQYSIPEDLRECLIERQQIITIRSELTQELCMQNYAITFSTLLHLEEIQMEIDIRDFDLEKASLKPVYGYLALEVPGLAEGRPSVMIGDKVILSIPDGQASCPEYEGYVHEVLREDLLLKFNPEFHATYQGEEYNVMFTFSRTSLRRCHQAVEFAKNLGEQVLFPTKTLTGLPQCSIMFDTQHEKKKTIVSRQDDDTKVKPKPKQRKSEHPKSKRKKKNASKETLKSKAAEQSVPGMKAALDVAMNRRFVVPIVETPVDQPGAGGDGHKRAHFYNTQLNARQKAAVIKILRGHCRPTPYILFGPPGTGKTVTLVEAILQVFQHIPSSRILACAPSNSASDLLTERLHASGLLQSSDMARLNAFSRKEETISETVQQYSHDGNSLTIVAHHRIVVSTCVTAGMLYQLGLKSGHFTHVFVDEAGQATEPECVVPAGLAVGNKGQIVLAGDPLQLGPVLTSRPAIRFGLGLSLLERLMSRPLYMRDPDKYTTNGNYNPFLVTKLVDNYRSHPALLSLPSQLFYHDELVPKADPEQRECLCQWNELPNKEGFPILFHGIKGDDLREGNSPSWFNPVEAVQVMKYLKSLLCNDVRPLKYSDIGVITPYRKQVEKIRLLIDSLGMEDIKVGSVEEFQGQERLVIIISTVRSTENLVGFDTRHNLGFLSNQKRFNVAITRAKALLVVIGNPYVLVQDYHWLSLLHYCIKNNAYIGCDLPNLDEEFAEKICSSMEKNLKTEGEDDCVNQVSSSETVEVIERESELLQHYPGTKVSGDQAEGSEGQHQEDSDVFQMEMNHAEQVPLKSDTGMPVNETDPVTLALRSEDSDNQSKEKQEGKDPPMERNGVDQVVTSDTIAVIIRDTDTVHLMPGLESKENQNKEKEENNDIKKNVGDGKGLQEDDSADSVSEDDTSPEFTMDTSENAELGSKTTGTDISRRDAKVSESGDCREKKSLADETCVSAVVIETNQEDSEILDLQNNTRNVSEELCINNESSVDRMLYHTPSGQQNDRSYDCVRSCQNSDDDNNEESTEELRNGGLSRSYSHVSDYTVTSPESQSQRSDVCIPGTVYHDNARAEIDLQKDEIDNVQVCAEGECKTLKNSIGIEIRDSSNRDMVAGRVSKEDMKGTSCDEQSIGEESISDEEEVMILPNSGEDFGGGSDDDDDDDDDGDGGGDVCDGGSGGGGGDDDGKKEGEVEHNSHCGSSPRRASDVGTITSDELDEKNVINPQIFKPLASLAELKDYRDNIISRKTGGVEVKLQDRKDKIVCTGEAQTQPLQRNTQGIMGSLNYRDNVQTQPLLCRDTVSDKKSSPQEEEIGLEYADYETEMMPRPLSLENRVSVPAIERWDEDWYEQRQSQLVHYKDVLYSGGVTDNATSLSVEERIDLHRVDTDDIKFENCLSDSKGQLGLIGQDAIRRSKDMPQPRHIQTVNNDLQIWKHPYNNTEFHSISDHTQDVVDDQMSSENKNGRFMYHSDDWRKRDVRPVMGDTSFTPQKRSNELFRVKSDVGSSFSGSLSEDTRSQINISCKASDNQKEHRSTGSREDFHGCQKYHSGVHHMVENLQDKRVNHIDQREPIQMKQENDKTLVSVEENDTSEFPAENSSSMRRRSKKGCTVACKLGRQHTGSHDKHHVYEETYASISFPLDSKWHTLKDGEDPYADVDVIIESSCDESLSDN